MVGVADVDTGNGGIVDNVDRETMGCVADDGGIVDNVDREALGCVADDGGIVDDDKITGNDSTGCVGDVDASNGGIGKGVDRETMGSDADDRVIMEDVESMGCDAAIRAANGGIVDDDASSDTGTMGCVCDEKGGRERKRFVEDVKSASKGVVDDVDIAGSKMKESCDE